MQVQHEKFEVRTNGKGTYEITDEVQEKIDKSGVRNGVVTIFVQHTSCSLTMMENAAPAARRDVERFFEKLVPEDADYEHDDEGPDDMPSHIRTVLTRTSVRSISRLCKQTQSQKSRHAPQPGGFCLRGRPLPMHKSHPPGAMIFR